MNTLNSLKRKIVKKEESILGQKYDYEKRIPSPSSLGVTSDGNLFSLVDDIDANMKYANILVFGNDPHPLGNNFFIKSGKCANNDEGKPCSNNIMDCADRYLYVRNIPTGKVPGMSRLGMGDINTPFKGIIPGFGEDIADLANVPEQMIQGLRGKSNNKCKKVTRSVGPAGAMWRETRWVPLIEPFQINKNEFLLGFIILLLVIVLVR
jgi:hypothetical protein